MAAEPTWPRPAHLGVALLVLILLAIPMLLYVVGAKAIEPANRPVGEPPANLNAHATSFKDASGQFVAAWLVDGYKGFGTVILLHGIRADRRSLLSRAQIFARSGYAVLMIDLQAHGESSGTNITFGYKEAESVIAAIKFARSRWPLNKIGIVGLSLGGASAVIASQMARADVYILEAVYSNLEDAIGNRLAVRLGETGRQLAFLLLWQVPLRLGFSADRLNIDEQISTLNAPLLLIAGQKDKRTTLKNSQKLFANASEPKSMWVIPDAGHQDFHQVMGSEYERRVLEFLSKHLQQ